MRKSFSTISLSSTGSSVSSETEYRCSYDRYGWTNFGVTDMMNFFNLVTRWTYLYLTIILRRTFSQRTHVPRAANSARCAILYSTEGKISACTRSG